MSTGTNRNKHILFAIVFGLLMLLSPTFLFFTPSNASVTATADAAPQPQPYFVTFHESGLPTGTSWSVNFIGTSSSSTSNVNFTNIAADTVQTFSISSVNTANNHYSPTPSSGTVYVSNNNVTVGISFYNETTSLPASGYDLNFTITNFPSVMPGVSWSWKATVSGASLPYGPVTSSSSSGNSINYFTGLSNGTYSYSLSPAYGTTLSNSTGLININGTNTTVDLSISLMKTYTVHFNESGLPADQKFSVSVYDSPTGGNHYSTTNTTFVTQNTFVNFYLINQTYDYSVNTPSGFQAHPSTGTVTVTGSIVNISIQFSVAGPLYPVNFHIVNPPATTPGISWNWGATVNGTFYGYSYNSTLALPNLPSGTYGYSISAYGIALSPRSGTFTINGNSTIVSLKVIPSWETLFKVTNLASSAFGYPSFDVQVTENIAGIGGGLVQGSPFSSAGGVASIPSLQNGTYYYTLTSTNPYFTISPTSGTFKINGKNSTVDLKETAQPVYSAQFVEKGLVSYSSISWGVILDNGFYYNDSTPIPSGGLSHVNAPGSFVDELPQGTYWVQAFVIDSGGKYHFMAPVKITVGDGGNMFTMQFSTATGTGSQLTSSDYAIIGGVSAAVAVGAIALYIWNGRRGPKP